MKWFSNAVLALGMLCVAIVLGMAVNLFGRMWVQAQNHDDCTERCWPDDVRFVTASGKCGCAGRHGGEP